MVDDRGFNRRRFMRGIAAAFLTHCVEGAAPDAPAILEGDHFDLVIDRLPGDITGRRVRATAVNGSMPGPLLRWREGETVALAVHNRLPVPTSIHWHGIRSPAEMDGVPGLSFRGIAPGETFIYRVPVKQRQVLVSQPQPFPEQTGLVGALHIEPKHRDPIESDRDYVLLLTDWTDENPATVFNNLKKQSDYYNYYRRTAGTFFLDAKKKSLRATVSDRLMLGRMNMTPTDIADVTSATYTHLVNGAPLAANWTVFLIEPGQRVRLRFINGSSMTLFDVRDANLGRLGNPGTGSVILRNRTAFLLSRWRSRRAVRSFIQRLHYAAADSTASDRTQFLQHTRSWPGHRDGLSGSRWRRLGCRISQIRAVRWFHLYGPLRRDGDLRAQRGPTFSRSTACFWILGVAISVEPLHVSHERRAIRG